MTGTSPVISESHVTDVGGLAVHRSLPRHGRRMVGAWCFLDRFGPIDVTPERTMTVGPHPHIGLHTVTWLVQGEVLHSDSLGNQQPIRPGQLNLMTAGGGIAHAEDARERSRTLDGVQLWVAQLESTRHAPPSFAHHADLPHVDLPHGQATILVGEFAGSRSPAATDSALIGVDIAGSGSLDVPLDPAFEHAVAVLHGSVRIENTHASPNELVYLGTDRQGLALFLREGIPDTRSGRPAVPRGDRHVVELRRARSHGARARLPGLDRPHGSVPIGHDLVATHRGTPPVLVAVTVLGRDALDSTKLPTHDRARKSSDESLGGGTWEARRTMRRWRSFEPHRCRSTT